VPSALTEALARAGTPVLHAGEGPATAERAAHLGCRVVPVAGELTSVSPVEPTANDLALLDALRGLFEAVHRAPSELSLGHAGGACGGQIGVTAGPDDAVHAPGEPGAPFVIDRAAATRSPFAKLRRPPLVLNAGHPLVAAAREHADPVLAASHLARALLLHHGLLDVARSEEILARVLAHLGVA
jgi:hypothetical protein